MTTMPMANNPCLRIFFRLISRPMQNISMTRPISDRTSTISMPDSGTVQTVVMTMPATIYPMSGGSLILLKTVEHSAARSVNAATLVITDSSIGIPPKGESRCGYKWLFGAFS